jgi:uncharacterized membrane protein (DUF4010 family)
VYQWWRLVDPQAEAAVVLSNPLELPAAIGFGALLALVTILAKVAEVWLGSAGIVALSAVSGVADVDAITLSLAGMSATGLDPEVAATGSVTAAATNGLVKGTVAAVVGGKRLGLAVALPLTAAGGLGALAVWPMPC